MLGDLHIRVDGACHGVREGYPSSQGGNRVRLMLLILSEYQSIPCLPAQSWRLSGGTIDAEVSPSEPNFHSFALSFFTVPLA
jgi:hypothetical protein